MLFELRGDEPVDKVFLGYLETYRKHLARAIYARQQEGISGSRYASWRGPGLPKPCSD